VPKLTESTAIIFGSVITATAAIVAAIITGIFALRAVSGQQQTQATSAVLAHVATQSIATQISPQNTVTASTDATLPSNTPQPTVTFSPTNAPLLPTSTTIPTDTPIPTATFVSGQVLFQDNFDSGKSLDWQTLTGTWRMLNSQLKADVSDVPSIILVGNQTWSDYIVDVNVFSTCTIASVRIIVRYTSSSYIALQTACDSTKWIIVTGTTEKTIATLNKGGLGSSSKAHIRIEVIRQSYSAYINGSLYLQTQDSTFTTGKVGLASLVTYLFLDNEVPQFDDFQVTVP